MTDLEKLDQEMALIASFNPEERAEFDRGMQPLSDERDRAIYAAYARQWTASDFSGHDCQKARSEAWVAYHESKDKILAKILEGRKKP